MADYRSIYTGTQIDEGIGKGLTAYQKPSGGIPDSDIASATTWNGKQDALVSGTNIKTINSNSILGSGNLVLDGLPDQTGKAGKYLKTNGTTASWGEVQTITPQIVVTAPTGSTVVATKGSTTLTATEVSGTWTFNITELGTWTITATLGSNVATADVNVSEVRQYTLTLNYITIMGISRNITDSSPSWTRTDEAVGLTFTRAVGSSGYHSDFDTMPIYKDIVRETISGDVLVKIPKFYFERKVVNNIETIRIADGQKDGFSVHPLFLNGNTELDYVYVGAYEGTASYTSKSGLSPLVSITRASARSGFAGRGTGYSQFDIACWSALQMLILVEVANYNSQLVIGNGNCGTSSAIATGRCDTMYNNGYITGCEADNTSSSVIWRGIENLWGNVWKWVDGINWNGGTYYVCTTPSNYADNTTSNYTQLSYVGGSTSYSNSKISREGCDASTPFVMMPTQASGSDTTYMCDSIWSSTGWRVCKYGGVWAEGSAAGLFEVAVSDASSYSGSSVGCRLLYRPL